MDQNRASADARHARMALTPVPRRRWPARGSWFRVLRDAPDVVGDLAADPLEIRATIHDAYVAEREQRGPQCQYEADDN